MKQHTLPIWHEGFYIHDKKIGVNTITLDIGEGETFNYDANTPMFGIPMKEHRFPEQSLTIPIDIVNTAYKKINIIIVAYVEILPENGTPTKVKTLIALYEGISKDDKEYLPLYSLDILIANEKISITNIDDLRGKSFVTCFTPSKTKVEIKDTSSEPLDYKEEIFYAWFIENKPDIWKIYDMLNTFVKTDIFKDAAQPVVVGTDSNTKCVYFPNAASTGRECVHCGQPKCMHV